MGPFPNSNGFLYILLAVDYVSKWVEAIPTRTDDANVVLSFVRNNIICRFGSPRAIVSDQEHKAYWAIKECNPSLGGAGIERKLQLAELECLRLEAYENSRLYKEKMKAIHDRNIRGKEFKAGDLVLLYISRLRLLPGKLRSKWEGPYQVVKAEPYWVYHLCHPSSSDIFKVNRHRLKLYHGEQMKSNKEIEVFLLEDTPRGKEQ
ncbi:uncharacterized protein [Arachis hypogaea]|uniref:uncharacterized protein n=1 Tax=Arachis hypogaea TaxID=3818 RepID=UPI000DEC25DA|nr:uncharacterized protein LOC112763402 [Arachis hypogaea]